LFIDAILSSDFQLWYQLALISEKYQFQLNRAIFLVLSLTPDQELKDISNNEASKKKFLERVYESFIKKDNTLLLRSLNNNRNNMETRVFTENLIELFNKFESEKLFEKVVFPQTICWTLFESLNIIHLIIDLLIFN